MKLYMDGDGEYPTICGTGTEEDFGGARCIENPETGLIMPDTTHYAGIHAMFLESGDAGFFCADCACEFYCVVIV